MARITGVNIPDNKRVEIALTYIYGIGRPRAKKILDQARVDKDIRTKDLTTSQLDTIKKIVEDQYQIEGEARVKVTQNVKRLKEINCYRGIRHAKNLPVRGQRTKTNARTKRGKKVTVGSGRKKTAEKT
jgi:small subunit ribosomal protein S13